MVNRRSERRWILGLVCLCCLISGCAGIAHMLGTMTPEEVEAKTAEITTMVDGLRTEVVKLRDDGVLPPATTEKILSVVGNVETLRDQIAKNAATVETLAARLATAAEAGAGVAGSIPGGQPVAGGVAMAAKALLLLSALAKGAKKEEE
jgi:hypothetical protein